MASLSHHYVKLPGYLDRNSSVENFKLLCLFEVTKISNHFFKPVLIDSSSSSICTFDEPWPGGTTRPKVTPGRLIFMEVMIFLKLCEDFRFPKRNNAL